MSSESNIRSGCGMGWVVSMNVLAQKEKSLSEGVRDFSTFYPIVDSARIICKEFVRSQGGIGAMLRPFDSFLTRKKIVSNEIQNIERYMLKDFHLNEIYEYEIHFTPHFHLLIDRTKRYLTGDWNELPRNWTDWVTFKR